MLQWRAMGEGDLAGVRVVSDAVHPELPESDAVLRERLRLYPEGCHVLAGANATIGGYVISHPIRPYEPPVLDRLLGALPSDATQYYVHDIALDPRLRGGGHARPIVEQLLAHARSFDSMALISVYGTAHSGRNSASAPRSALWIKRYRPMGRAHCSWFGQKADPGFRSHISAPAFRGGRFRLRTLCDQFDHLFVFR